MLASTIGSFRILAAAPQDRQSSGGRHRPGAPWSDLCVCGQAGRRGRTDFPQAIASGTIVHTDESRAWDVLHASYDTRRVNHSIELVRRGWRIRKLVRKL